MKFKIKNALFVFSICMILILVKQNSSAQNNFVRVDTIAVKGEFGWLKHPWAGGFNNPQFSQVDMNNDGTKDIFIYDRASDRTFTFIKTGSIGTTDYEFRPEYRSAFPTLHHWVIMKDFNGDGREDIFTSGVAGGQVGVAVYLNASDQTGLHFVRMYPQLLSANNFPIYVSQWDIPAIADIEGDGDLDLITFEISGSKILMYRNLSMDMYGHNDSLDFEMYDDCWGKFMENFGDCSVTLNLACKPDAENNIQQKTNDMHAGSTILALHTDSNLLTDILVGDIICPSMYLLLNTGDTLNAIFSQHFPDYPFDIPIQLRSFPAAFSLDVNGDGLNDLISSPNAMNISNNIKDVWLYLNYGNNIKPDFVFETNTFLQSDMIEHGESSYPVFFDYDMDGDADLFIGNQHYLYPNSSIESKLAFYKNTGTVTNPVFEFVTSDYENISAFGFSSLHPTFGDMDGDRDYDMLIGDEDGYVHYFENIAAAGLPADFIVKQTVYQNIDVGQFAAPQLVDVNRDGLIDLLIGKKSGSISYYQNTGDAGNPVFTLQTDSFGSVDVKTSGEVTGYSVPFLFDFAGRCQYTLLVASESGNIFEYDKIDGNLSGQFKPVSTHYENIFEGKRSSIYGGDINNDGRTDLIIGNNGGGAVIYFNQSQKPSPCFEVTEFNVIIYPNPVSQNGYIVVNGISTGSSATIEIFNITGQIILRNEIASQTNNIELQLPAEFFSNGTYMCRIITDLNTYSTKFIVTGN